ncbi:MAG TPA: hypothetical protein VFY90_05480 [Tepidiformaceae bacterium]|nr:hypothetical protein [Tepidiformaceae bacterium]
MTAEPSSNRARGRTATGGIPNPEEAARLVREWANDEASADEQRETLALLMKAFEEARLPMPPE